MLSIYSWRQFKLWPQQVFLCFKSVIFWNLLRECEKDNKKHLDIFISYSTYSGCSILITGDRVFHMRCPSEILWGKQPNWFQYHIPNNMGMWKYFLNYLKMPLKFNMTKKGQPNNNNKKY